MDGFRAVAVAVAQELLVDAEETHGDRKSHLFSLFYVLYIYIYIHVALLEEDFSLSFPYLDCSC